MGLAALAAAALWAGCQTGEGGLGAIRKAGVLRVGVKSDVPGFGLLNAAANQYEGFEIELARLIAGDILGDPGKAAFTPVTAKTRGPLLDNGELDLIIATFSITEERQGVYHFSPPYYTDAVGLMVKKSSGIRGIGDLDGKTIGVAQSATSRAAIDAAAKAAGVSPQFAEFATYREIKAALDSGGVDAFSVDRSILAGYLDAESEIVPDRFSPQEYGVACKLSNRELAARIDGLMAQWLSDGTIAGLLRRFNL
jgi:putative glutamine transport system substrate-binding protein